MTETAKLSPIKADSVVERDDQLCARDPCAERLERVRDRDDLSTLRLVRRDQDLPPEVIDASLERARSRFEAAGAGDHGPEGRDAVPARLAPVSGRLDARPACSPGRRSWSPARWSPPGSRGNAVVRAGAAAAADGSGGAGERGDGGDFTVGELGGKPSGVLGAADIAVLPRDPDALDRRIKAHPVARGATNEVHVFDTISGLLRTGLVPADLRATRYEALASLPDVVVTEEQASLDGRTGAAIGLPGGVECDGAARRHHRPDRWHVPGGAEHPDRRTGSIPAGTVIDSVAVHVTPVDDEP